MQPITTIKQLIRNLNMGPGYEGYKALIQAIELERSELDKICQWGENHTRICLYDTDCLECLITCWSPGQTSPIHNYNFQQGWIKVLQGELILEYFNVEDGSKEIELTHREFMQTGDFTYINDSLGFHRFANTNAEEAIAIHLYADKVTEWSVYDDATGRMETIPTSYDMVIE